MCVRLGHLQGNLPQSVCEAARPRARFCGKFCPQGQTQRPRPVDETGSCVWLRSRGAACGRNSRGGAGAAVQIFKRTASGAENLGNGNPGQRSNFHKGAPAARRENWPSARGQRSVFCGGVVPPEGKQGAAARGRGPALQGPGGENPARTAPAPRPGRGRARVDRFLARVSNNF